MDELNRKLQQSFGLAAVGSGELWRRISQIDTVHPVHPRKSLVKFTYYGSRVVQLITFISVVINLMQG